MKIERFFLWIAFYKQIQFDKILFSKYFMFSNFVILNHGKRKSEFF